MKNWTLSYKAFKCQQRKNLQPIKYQPEKSSKAKEVQCHGSWEKQYLRGGQHNRADDGKWPLDLSATVMSGKEGGKFHRLHWNANIIFCWFLTTSPELYAVGVIPPTQSHNVHPTHLCMVMTGYILLPEVYSAEHYGHDKSYTSGFRWLSWANDALYSPPLLQFSWKSSLNVLMSLTHKRIHFRKLKILWSLHYTFTGNTC